MYQFTNATLSGLTVSQSIAKSGTKHLKQYATPGVTPVSQDTLNVYLSGVFRFEAGAFSRVMGAGDTSLDLSIAQYPTDTPCVETVLSDWGMRCCISSKAPWTRTRVELAASGTHTLTHNGLVVLLRGEARVGGSTMRAVSYREAPAGATLMAGSTSASLIICRLL